MQYHAIASYEEERHFWWNYSEEAIKERVVLPFLRGHIRLIRHRDKKALLNFRTVNLVQVFSSADALEPTESMSIIQQIEKCDEPIEDCTVEFLDALELANVSEETKSLIQMAHAQCLPQIFVVMRFGNPELDSAYEGVIRPVSKEFELETVRVDEIQDAGRITDQILSNIAQSKYVICDLSGELPNCYYEAGFAHALGKELILSIRKGDPIHFDLSANRFIEWNTESEFRNKLRARLQALENSDMS